MNFRGKADATIDSKQRLAIPAKFRAKIDESRDGTSWVAFAWHGESLWLYPVKQYEALATEKQGTLTPSAEQAEWQRTFFGLSEDLEPDSAGRVTISKELAERAGLGGEVTVVGSGNRLEIHDRTRWESKESVRQAAFGSLNQQVNQPNT
ncbi:MAG: hypothetical protein HRU70_03460 [Phycisphaeraceae bacterium]|nr:MAG: hypothetical protein HRU70_03460 [Phycisphaeraceae bacterium]